MRRRRVRAVILSACVWGTIWFPVGLLHGVIRWRRARPYDVLIAGRLERVPIWPYLISSAIVWSVCGAVGGLLFALTLRRLAGGRAVRRLSLYTVGASGALVAVAVPMAFLTRLLPFDARTRWVALAVLATAGCVGAVSAGSILYLAQRSDRAASSPPEA